MAFSTFAGFTIDWTTKPTEISGQASNMKSWLNSRSSEAVSYTQTIVTELEATSTGTSGASKVGVSAISGWSGDDVQEVLESAKAATQPLDATLTALAALGSTAGFIAQSTTPDTFNKRTLTAPAAGIAITCGNGSTGDPTLALANDLAALEGLSTYGMAARTGDDAWAVRTITAPAAGITIACGNGSTGNPTLALANDLAAVEGLTTYGIVQRTSTDTWTTTPIGTTGQVPTVDAAGTALTYSDRKIKNWVTDGGNFEIAQAVPTVGTEVTDPANATYPIFDLWQSLFVADGATLPTVKHSQQLITSGAVPGAKYCYRINVDGAGSGYTINSRYRVQTYIEHGVQSLCGASRYVTIPFYARTSIVGKKIITQGVQDYGTGGSPSAGEWLGAKTHTLTSDWTKFYHTIETNTLSGKTFGTANNDAIQLIFWLLDGSSADAGMNSFVGAGDIEIASVEMVEGNIALPTSKLKPEEALAACQRFYWKTFDYGTAVAQNCGSYLGAISYVASTTGVSSKSVWVNFPVKMRTNPVVTFYCPSAASAKWYNRAVSAESGTGDVPYSTTVGQGGFAVYNTQVAGDNSANTLYIHASADARF